MRVVIDTNIWISFLIGKSLTGLSNAIISGQITILFSEELFAELIEVLQRPKFKKYFSATAIEELIALLYDRVEWIEIIHQFDDCRDKKDNFLLDLSVSGHADYLVTGDDDLITLNPFKPILWCRDHCLSHLSSHSVSKIVFHKSQLHKYPTFISPLIGIAY